MPRGDKSGSTYQLPDGRWYTQKKYIKLNGREGKKSRIVNSKSALTRARAAILDEIEKELAGLSVPPALAGGPKTFADLATHFKTNYLKPAVWHEDSKVEGMKSYDRHLSTLGFLERELGPERELRTITWQDMSDLKSRRLRSPVIIQRGKGKGPITRQRSIASVQQPLKLARRMFNVAVRLGRQNKNEIWMTENPFNCGDPLIILAHEKKRDRIFSREEESRAFEVWSERLIELTLLAIYTAARENELETLKLTDIWLDRRMFQIRGRNAKTETRRLVPIFEPVMPIFRRMVAQSQDGYLLPPGSREYIDRHFRPSCDLAGIENLQWRDFRHTGTSRIVRILKNPILAMKVTGHTNYKTFIQVYVNIDEETANEIREKVDAALLSDHLWSLNEDGETSSQKPS